MNFEVNELWVTAVLLCSLRLAALLMMTPMLQAIGLPVRIRVLFILALSVSLVSGMHLTPANIPTDLHSLILSGITEVMVGSLMAFGIFAAFAAFSFAGNALDIQIGFNIANIYDPVTHSQSPLIASLLGMVAVALFFTMNAHHTVLRGVAYSLEHIPLGALLSPPAPAALVKQFGSIFSLGLMLAAPPLFCLFLVEICLAVLSRNLPQLNIFLLSVPIKIAVGLSVLAFVAGHFGSVATKIFDSLFGFWEEVL
jgi:flagellar biosynthetic protein FliR